MAAARKGRTPTDGPEPGAASPDPDPPADTGVDVGVAAGVTPADDAGAAPAERPTLPYPHEWEADVLLADGGVAHLRPVRPDDTQALRHMHERSSERTKYLRYFSVVNEVTPQLLSVFTEVDHDRRVGLVVELAGEIIAAGTYHAAPHTSSAEVAFLVEDAHQRRGLGSILLEHLASAAQERGLRKFTAEVLAENQQMVRVFIDAGYAVKREYDSGVIDLEFDIAPTEASRAVLASREQRAESRSIARLLSPRSVAVIGASAERTKLGHAVLVNLLRGDFAGPVYPVNPETLSVQGVRAYRSVTDIPDPVDLAVVAVPAGSVTEVVQACQDKGVRGLVVVSAGFADADESGADAQRHLVSVARANGMRVVGPNCLGLVNTDPAVRLNATLAGVVPRPGRIGFFCQSGALGIALLADAASRGLGLSSFVSAGNRADVSGNDLLQYWLSDDRTEVVLLYLESFGNPRKFARLARGLARTKPVIAVKSGRHAMVTPGLAANAAVISERVVAALFAQSGVIRTQTVAEAFDAAQLLSSQPVPAGDRVVIVGNSTALGVLAMDACLDAGLRVADTRPIDLGVNAAPDELASAVREALERADVDAAVVVYVPPVATPGLEHASALLAATSAAASAGLAKPVVTTFLGVDGLPEHLAVPATDGSAGRGSVPSYRTPERAVAALAHAVRYGAWRSRPVGEVPVLAGIDRAKAAALIDAMALADTEHPREARPLTDLEMVGLLRCYGIELARFRVAMSADEATAAANELGFPVALKAYDEGLRHRVDQAGVRVGLHTEGQVAAAYEVVSELSGPTVYIQEMAAPGRSGVATEFAVRADPSFGALVSFGISGLTTELLDDRAYRAVPLTDVDAVELIDGPQSSPLLDGYRGSPACARGPLHELALRLSALADDFPHVHSLKLRPVLAGPEGITVTGAVGRIGPPPARPDERRRLS